VCKTMRLNAAPSAVRTAPLPGAGGSPSQPFRDVKGSMRFIDKVARARVKVPLSVGLDPITTRANAYSLTEAQESLDGWQPTPYVPLNVQNRGFDFQCQKEGQGGFLPHTESSGHAYLAGEKFHTWAGIVHDPMKSTLVPITKPEGLTRNHLILSLVTTIIGVGVVTLPSLMKLGGWVVVPTLAVLISLAFSEVGRVIADAIGMAEANNPPQHVMSFEDFGRAALGTKGALLVRSITTTGFAGTLVIYTILIGSNLCVVFGGRLPMIVIMAFATPVLILLALLRDMQKVVQFMKIGVVASLSSCVLICIKSMMDARTWEDWPPDVQEDMHSLWPEDFASLGTIVAVLFSAFSVISTVPTLRAEMQNTKEFLFAFRVTIAIVCVAYICVMISGYWGYGNFVQDNVVQSMMFAPKSPEEALAEKREVGTPSVSSALLARAMAVLMTTYLFPSFALFFACFFGAVQKIGFGAQCCAPGTVMNVLFRVFLVLVCVVVGLKVPHFREVMAIIASVCCSCNNVFFPLFFAHVLARRPGGTKPSICRHFVHFFIFLLAMFCLVFGLKDSITRLVSKMA